MIYRGGCHQGTDFCQKNTIESETKDKKLQNVWIVVHRTEFINLDNSTE